jgi:hypothetical protein
VANATAHIKAEAGRKMTSEVVPMPDEPPVKKTRTRKPVRSQNWSVQDSRELEEGCKAYPFDKRRPAQGRTEITFIGRHLWLRASDGGDHHLWKATMTGVVSNGMI